MNRPLFPRPQSTTFFKSSTAHVNLASSSAVQENVEVASLDLLGRGFSSSILGAVVSEMGFKTQISDVGQDFWAQQIKCLVPSSTTEYHLPTKITCEIGSPTFPRLSRARTRKTWRPEVISCLDQVPVKPSPHILYAWPSKEHSKVAASFETQRNGGIILAR